MAALAIVLVAWLIPAPRNRCILYRNLGYVYLAKGTLAARGDLDAAVRWFSASRPAGCDASAVTFGLAQSYAGLGRPAAAVSAFGQGGDRADLRRFFIGTLYEESGRTEDAGRIYRALPRDAAAYFNKLGARADRAA